MPFSPIKRTLRRAYRKTRSWGHVVSLTLGGNTVEKKASLFRCRKPVLLLYGFFSTRRTLAVLEKRLFMDGFTVFSINLGGIFGTFNAHNIENVASFVQEKIERLYKKYEIQGKLSLICHSKGGLIGNYYVKKLGGNKRVKLVITIGTPHNGSPWATIGTIPPLSFVFKSLKQMAPQANFLEDLKKTKLTKDVMLYSIYSKDDIMCPYPASVLDEAPNVKNIEVPGMAHSEFLIKKSAYHVIKHALEGNMPKSWEEKTRENLRKAGEVKKRPPFKFFQEAKKLVKRNLS